MDSIIIAGDFCPRERVSSLFERRDYQSVLGDVKTVLSDSTYSIVNLECPVARVDAMPIAKWGGNLRCSENGVEALKWAGFDCVTLANNHFYDYGEEGVKNTLQACVKYDIDIVGGGSNLEDASKILYKQVNDKTLAVINCCEHEFSIATTVKGGSNPLNPVSLYNSIKNANEKADYVLVIVHGGHEHYQLPSPRMIETYRFFIDSGADAVVNHHQHCFSGYEVYRGKPIFYGLGNFCFDGNLSGRDIWYEGYMVKLNLDAASFELIPYIQCKGAPSVVLLEVNAFDTRIGAINSIIEEPSDLESAISNFYNNSSKYYGDLFEPFNNRYYLGLKHRGFLPSFINKKRLLKVLNYIECEAHRDIFLHYLHNN